MHMGERERGWNVVGMGIGDIKAEGEGGGGGTTVTIHGSDDRRGLVGMHALVYQRTRLTKMVVAIIQVERLVVKDGMDHTTLRDNSRGGRDGW
ncbi:hypothetical protein L2E82_18503 [Cichorium intybus]|uniref:Uncharacterized protein n=1 Tax=Cichorium intybus TaxID=13427 RepID=A0ACB9FBL5_CICIN|nr:hypothetical protein L2E82_18503 [Cichorium intybus]